MLREGAALAVVGTGLGFAGALVLKRLLAAYSEMLARSFAGDALDSVFFYAAPLVLSALVILACYLPARRAASIHPMATLRDE